MKEKKAVKGTIETKKSSLTFKNLYLAYLMFLIVAVIAALMYVNGLLHRYEDMLPEQRVEEAVQQLIAEAGEEDFWKKYVMPDIKVGKFEEHLNVQEIYLGMYAEGDITYKQQNIAHAEDELYYVVENNGVALAEVKLKATGPTETKLAVLSVREWQVASVEPMLNPVEYTLTVPVDFGVKVNGITLTDADGVNSKENEITYTIKDIYLEPVFAITDKSGAEVSYHILNHQVLAEFYHYTLTLPAMLTVKLNGAECQGTAAGDNLMRYDICVLEKPEIEISDFYGNVCSYQGGDELPLTYATITVEEGHTVTVADQPVPENCVTTYANTEYGQLRDYVENLPQICVYDIAMLAENAELSVVDKEGKMLRLENGQTEYDFLAYTDAASALPEEIAAEIDVLEVAKNWSLFMSKDFPIAQIKEYLLADSYQYKMAVKYASSIDITFTSAHTLGNPAFTDISVTNYKSITENCFSIDISFVKHMILKNGNKVDDTMNDRFYFVKYDDTNDKVDNPAWKLVSMKEIVSNGK